MGGAKSVLYLLKQQQEGGQKTGYPNWCYSLCVCVCVCVCVEYNSVTILVCKHIIIFYFSGFSVMCTKSVLSIDLVKHCVLTLVSGQ